MHVNFPGKKVRLWTHNRELNAVTNDHTYHISNIEERVELVDKAKYISTMYPVWGYWQVALTEDARRYAVFVSHAGTVLPTVMRFVL